MPKVLLIEDDPTMLILLSTLLEMEGYQVVKLKHEETIDELLALLRREKPDAAMVDVHLHQVNGFDLLARARQDPKLKHVHILMSSGLDVSHECIEAGADDFILKPYTPDDLIHRIRAILE
jgi:DNA-binding response OmpR family regulator